jgi:glycosyltransferase involved in cell wall biosynthesis
MEHMIYLAFIYLVFLVLRLVVLAVNYFWRPYLKQTTYTGTKTVSILIPARNEAVTLPLLFGKLLAQTHAPGEILVYDDDSDDNTWEVLQLFASISKVIKPIKGEKLPDDWLGKNHACYQLAKQARGDYFLFLDADVTPEPELIESALVFAEKKQLALLSLFPEQETITLGEKVTVPIMLQILLSLLPLPLVYYSHKPSLAAANGQFMLFDAGVYRKLKPHAWVKKSPVEDIQIIRYYKKLHLKVATLLGNGIIKCRMYNSYEESLRGFSKNFTAFFSHSSIFLMFYLCITTFGWIALFWLPPMGLALGLAGILLLVMLRNLITKSPWLYLFLVPFQQLNYWVLAYYSQWGKKKNALTWKNRKI